MGLFARLPFRLSLEKKERKATVSAGLSELGAVILSGLRALSLVLTTRITITAHIIATGIAEMATVNVINSTDRIRPS